MTVTSPSGLIADGLQKKRCFQRLCPQDELRLPPASLGESLRSAGRSGPGSFPIAVSALAHGVCETCVHPASTEPIADCLGLLRERPPVLQSQTFRALLPAAGTPALESLMRGFDPPLLGDKR